MSRLREVTFVVKRKWILLILTMNLMCKVSCDWVQYENTCYWVSEIKTNFTVARDVCHTMDSELVNIETTHEFEIINSLIQDLNSYEYWVNLQHYPNGEFRWGNSQTVIQSFWEDSQPDGSGNCVRLRFPSDGPTHKLADNGCELMYRYICEKSSSGTASGKSSARNDGVEHLCPYLDFTARTLLQCASFCYRDPSCKTFGMTEDGAKCLFFKEEENCNDPTTARIYYSRKLSCAM